MNVMLSISPFSGRPEGALVSRATCPSGATAERGGRRSPRRRGFSFAEVMFAVVILGIGFIMVAAIFPVAIQQTQATGEENAAAIAARDAADGIIQIPHYVTNPAPAKYQAANMKSYVLANPPDYTTAYNDNSVSQYPVFPPTIKNYVLPTASPLPAGVVAPPAIVVPFTGTRWKLIQSDSVVVSDQRYAYVPFYRRENGSGAAELIVIAVAVRNKPVYTTSGDALNNNPVTASITTTRGGYSSALMMAKLLGQTVICPDTISSSSGAEGASVSTPNTFATGVRTYTFGRNLGGSWEINAGDGLALAAGTGGVWSGATAGTPDGPYTLSPPTSTSASGSQWGSSGAIYDPPGTTASCTYNPPATLQPQPAYASQLQATPANPAGQITLLSSFWSANPPPNAGPGAFVIVADDYPFAPGGYNSPSYALPPANVVGGAPPFNVGALNGRIFRLGSLVGPSAAGGTIYNLDPAYGMLPNGPYNASPDTVPSPSIPGGPNSYIGQWGIKVYIVGVGQVNNAYVGPTQDTGVFATYFSVN